MTAANDKDLDQQLELEDDAAFDEAAMNEDLGIITERKSALPKLLAGVAVVAILLGGGFYAYKTYLAPDMPTPVAAVPADVPAAMTPPGAPVDAMAGPGPAPADGMAPPAPPAAPDAVAGSMPPGEPITPAEAANAMNNIDPVTGQPIGGMPGGMAPPPAADPNAPQPMPMPAPMPPAGDAAAAGTPPAPADMNQPAPMPAPMPAPAPDMAAAPAPMPAPAAEPPAAAPAPVTPQPAAAPAVNAEANAELQQQISTLQNRVAELEGQLNSLKQQPAAAPAGDTVSKAEFDALSKRIDELSSRPAAPAPAKPEVEKAAAKPAPVAKPIKLSHPRVRATESGMQVPVAPAPSVATPPGIKSSTWAGSTGTVSTNVDRMMGSAPAAQPAPPAAVPVAPVTGDSLDQPGKTLSGSWMLRSAQPGRALISQGDSQEIRSVAVGDEVPGLGRVMAISQDSAGKWSVRGTLGTINQ